MLGDDWHDYVPSDIERKDVDAFLVKYRASHAFNDRKDGRKELVAGSDGWTLPVPLTKVDGGWRFDLRAGADEIRTRRIGRNELDVEQAVRAYHDAQMDYAEADRDGDGVLEYATRIRQHRRAARRPVLGARRQRRDQPARPAVRRRHAEGRITSAITTAS